MKHRFASWPPGSSDATPLTQRSRGKKGRMTLLEYYNTPESVLPRELVDGVMYVRDAPFVSHQRIVLELAIALRAHALKAGGEVIIAPADVILDERRPLVLQPDLLYLTPERQSLAMDRVYGAPDVVIEVLSPRPRIGDLDQKVGWYAEYGVREIWLVNQTSRRVQILECEGGQVARKREVAGAITSGVLPGFEALLIDVLGY